MRLRTLLLGALLSGVTATIVSSIYLFASLTIADHEFSQEAWRSLPHYPLVLGKTAFPFGFAAALIGLPSLRFLRTCFHLPLAAASTLLAILLSWTVQWIWTRTPLSGMLPFCLVVGISSALVATYFTKLELETPKSSVPA